MQTFIMPYGNPNAGRDKRSARSDPKVPATARGLGTACMNCKARIPAFAGMTVNL